MATRDVVFSANVDGNGGSGKEPPGSGDSEEQISFKNMGTTTAKQTPVTINTTIIPLVVTPPNVKENNGDITIGANIDEEREYLHWQWLVVKGRSRSKSHKNQSKSGNESITKNQRQSTINYKKEKGVAAKPKACTGYFVWASRRRVVIYDVGFGDKSTIPMQEITHNSFVHLPDDQNDLDQNMDVVNANTQTPAGQYDMVPETQLEVQMVTT
ncbi:hypothetical protein JHK85_012550 [Glycine max]|nr:hypothetical protein JHK87_012110 [Glycine soja]KAG5040074.1 hypothetical protein JHK85_012550 [Glycine max]KAG5057220.1 hypothetical protein JHK86_012216 [Glycine max]